MAWKDEEAKALAEKMIIKGQSIKEVMAAVAGRCEIYNVYDLKKNLKLAGKIQISEKHDDPVRIGKAIDALKSKSKKETAAPVTSAFLTALIKEQERLRKCSEAIDSLLSIYDDLIPLPKSLK